MKIHSAVVSQVVPVAFAGLAQAAEELPGQEFGDDRTRLKVQSFVGAGFAGAIRFGGTLRTLPLLPSVKVEVVISPWSVGRTEVAIHPMTPLGGFESFRSTRFFNATRSILPLVIDRLCAQLPVEIPAALELAA